MTLCAQSLHTFQSCARRHALEQKYRVIRHRPKALFETLLRHAILEMSNGADSKAVALEATTRFLELSASPGLDTLRDPYTIARDFCAILETVLEAISRMVLLVVKPGAKLSVGAHDWQVSAFQDESGTLHRWIAVDRWDDDARYRELHSWACFGDCAAAEANMILHVVEIGQHRKGHQHIAWCRAFRHPMMPTKFRFRKVDGGPLGPGWDPVWYQDSSANKPAAWVDLMQEDRLELIHHVDIREPAREHVEQFRREVAAEASRMGASWQSTPMSRPACDIPYACPWQDVCYAPPGPVNVPALGYIKLGNA